MPSIPGSWRSMRTRSGRRSAASATPSSAVAASSTREAVRSSSTSRTSLRLRSLSSTTRISVRPSWRPPGAWRRRGRTVARSTARRAQPGRTAPLLATYADLAVEPVLVLAGQRLWPSERRSGCRRRRGRRAAASTTAKPSSPGMSRSTQDDGGLLAPHKRRRRRSPVVAPRTVQPSRLEHGSDERRGRSGRHRWRRRSARGPGSTVTRCRAPSRTSSRPTGLTR